ncbi:hypothetical protein [Vibrio ziniensis]|uniref:Uncharacterized protein n=1 Tax=Vibrio ziniensis TaxID=2711221 RepID=A0A6G7CHY2_9VIBR|nr:hypothetical protein [Vibrio ziniensis]QIH41717.1 hypothetical protein G5S32_06835 [Vibrio ziniensis]
MKASELKALLDALPQGFDPDVVMGEDWLPERLINTHLDSDFLFLEFDNAPEEDQGDEEGRGFVEHEIEMIRSQIETLLSEENKGIKTKAETLLTLLIMAHERTSSEFIELIEPFAEDEQF